MICLATGNGVGALAFTPAEVGSTMDPVLLGAAQQYDHATVSCSLGSCSSFHLLIPIMQQTSKLKVLLMSKLVHAA